MLAIDTATDVPLSSHDHLQRHRVLKSREIHEVPRHPLQLQSDNCFLMQILRFISFDLTLGPYTLQIDCFVTPCLGPDIVFLSNDIIARLVTILDWSSPTRLSNVSAETLPALHRHEMPSVSTCSRIALIDDATPVKGRTHSNVGVPSPSEMVMEVRTTGPSRRSWLSLF